MTTKISQITLLCSWLSNWNRAQVQQTTKESQRLTNFIVEPALRWVKLLPVVPVRQDLRGTAYIVNDVPSIDQQESGLPQLPPSEQLQHDHQIINEWETVAYFQFLKETSFDKVLKFDSFILALRMEKGSRNINWRRIQQLPLGTTQGSWRPRAISSVSCLSLVTVFCFLCINIITRDSVSKKSSK